MLAGSAATKASATEAVATAVAEDIPPEIVAGVLDVQTGSEWDLKLHFVVRGKELRGCIREEEQHVEPPLISFRLCDCRVHYPSRNERPMLKSAGRETMFRISTKTRPKQRLVLDAGGGDKELRDMWILAMGNAGAAVPKKILPRLDPAAAAAAQMRREAAQEPSSTCDAAVDDSDDDFVWVDTTDTGMELKKIVEGATVPEKVAVQSISPFMASAPNDFSEMLTWLQSKDPSTFNVADKLACARVLLTGITYSEVNAYCDRVDDAKRSEHLRRQTGREPLSKLKT